MMRAVQGDDQRLENAALPSCSRAAPFDVRVVSASMGLYSLSFSGEGRMATSGTTSISPRIVPCPVFMALFGIGGGVLATFPLWRAVRGRLYHWRYPLCCEDGLRRVSNAGLPDHESGVLRARYYGGRSFTSSSRPFTGPAAGAMEEPWKVVNLGHPSPLPCWLG